MELISRNVEVLEPMVDILDKKNITNCIYYSDINPEYERRLFINVLRLSDVNKTILYTMAEVYTDSFTFGDALLDDKEQFVTYKGYNKKDNYAKHNLVCFSLPNFGSEYNDYTIGFFLEFANCFVKQEPIPVLDNIYTREEMDRYQEYHSSGREDFKDIALLVSLGKYHPLQNDKNAIRVKSVKFSDGMVVQSHGGKLNTINKNFSLTTDKALNNYSRYKLEKDKEEKAKQKAKTTNGSL